MKEHLEDIIGAVLVFAVPFVLGWVAYGFGG